MEFVSVLFSCIVLVYLVVYFRVVLLFTLHDLFTLSFTIRIYLFIYHCSPCSSPTHGMFCVIVCYSVGVFANLLMIVCTVIHTPLDHPSLLYYHFRIPTYCFCQCYVFPLDPFSHSLRLHYPSSCSSHLLLINPPALD